jgi:hypothetical protein
MWVDQEFRLDLQRNLDERESRCYSLDNLKFGAYAGLDLQQLPI